MKITPRKQPPSKQTEHSGRRHWFRITGLPGWKRAQLGLPAFSQADCITGQAASRKRGRVEHGKQDPERQSRPDAGREGQPVQALPAPTGSQRLFTIWKELGAHVPFTAFGTITGVFVLAILIWSQASRSFSATLFWTLHPLHVFLSALVTTAMFRRHSGNGVWATVSIGYFGSVGIATLSDCLLPYAGEWLLALPHRGLHLGFVEKWWLVNPLALGGILLAVRWPHTKFAHAGHVLISTWASLFHMTMAVGAPVGIGQAVLIGLFLFLSVWVPCCTSDIVFPLLFIPKTTHHAEPVATNPHLNL
jgi:hypothetical protein